MPPSRPSSTSPSPTATHVDNEAEAEGDRYVDADGYEVRDGEHSGPVVPGVEGAIDRTPPTHSRPRTQKHDDRQSGASAPRAAHTSLSSSPKLHAKFSAQAQPEPSTDATSATTARGASLPPPTPPPSATSAAAPAAATATASDTADPAFHSLARPNTANTASSAHVPYSAFSQRTKWMIVSLGGIAALFSPISSNIFVPAIPTLATAFHRSQEDISLAVTVYLIFQAITPSFFGSMSDSYGRRPVYIGTLVVYMGANIGLACCPTSAYWLLLFLRALQATGGSAVVAIGAGSVADVAEPRERGLFMAIFQCGAMVGPAFGPLLGGVFADTLGWRAIFWFLVIATGVVLVPLIFMQPETLRSLVGDGSIPPPPYCMSPIMLVKRRRMEKELKERGEEGQKIERPPKKPYHPFSAFVILFTPEIILVFVFVSFMYIEFYCVLTLFSTALKDTYHLNDLQIGLCYLPSGCGSVLSSLLNGRQIDYYYRREERRCGGDYRKMGEAFRIERTRLFCIFPFMALFLVATTALGWCLQAKAPLAATLVVNFFIGLGTGTINTATVYGQDLKPSKGGAVSASLNLVRCIFGAVGTAIIQIIYNAMGAGWTMVLLSGICVASLPLPWLVVRNAKRWRLDRAEKAEAKQRRKMDAEAGGQDAEHTEQGGVLGKVAKANGEGGVETSNVVTERGERGTNEVAEPARSGEEEKGNEIAMREGEEDKGNKLGTGNGEK